jgi:hypothetical protein
MHNFAAESACSLCIFVVRMPRSSINLFSLQPPARRASRWRLAATRLARTRLFSVGRKHTAQALLDARRAC